MADPLAFDVDAEEFRNDKSVQVTSMYLSFLLFYNINNANNNNTHK